MSPSYVGGGWGRTTVRSLSRLAVIAFSLALLLALVALMAGLGSRFGLWHFRTGFTMLRWAGYGALAVAILSLVGAVVARPRGPRRGFALAVAGLILALGTAGVLWQWQRVARSVPPIHDITTDTQNPPEFVAIRPLRADAPNPPEYPGEEVASQQRQAYPDIRPLILPVPPAQAYEQALEAARRMGWEIVDADPRAGRIEATAQTFWFGFKDDVVVRITPAPEGSRIDVRSKSRVGRGDTGTNARRIRSYLERVQRE